MDEPRVRIGLKKAEDIKPEVREKHNLPDSGIVVKTITKASPMDINYEAIGGTFFNRLDEGISNLDPSFIEGMNKEL